MTTSLLAIPTLGFEASIGLRLIAGIGTALWSISRHAYIAESIPAAERGKALSTFGGLQRLGTLGGPALGGILYGVFWRPTGRFLASGILSGVAFVVALILVRDIAAAVKRLTSRHRWLTVRQAVVDNRRDLAAAGAAQTFAQMIRTGADADHPALRLQLPRAV